MSDPIHAFSIKIVSAASMGASVNSDPTNLDGIVSYSVQAVYSGGSPVGSIQLQCSNDYDPALASGTWTDISLSVAAISAAGRTALVTWGREVSATAAAATAIVIRATIRAASPCILGIVIGLVCVELRTARRGHVRV